MSPLGLLLLLLDAPALAHPRGFVSRVVAAPPPPRQRIRCTQTEAVHIVWFTGACDLRISDHGGLSAAAAADALCVPTFILDDDLHLDCPEPTLRRLHSALLGLDSELRSRYDSSLVFRRGNCAKAIAEIAKETKASVCHVIVNDVTCKFREAQTAVRDALLKADVDVRVWTPGLRPDAPWASTGAAAKYLPATYDEYVRLAREVPYAAPRPAPRALRTLDRLKSQPLPTVGALLEVADQHSPRAKRISRARAKFATTEPFDQVLGAWCTERSAMQAVEEYIRDGRTAFCGRYFSEAMPRDMPDDDDDEPDEEDEGSDRADDGVAAGSEASELGGGSAPAEASSHSSASAPANEDEDSLESGVGKEITSDADADGADDPLDLDDVDDDDDGGMDDEEGEDEMDLDDIVVPLSPPSLHAAAAQWILPPSDGAPPSAEAVAARLALREAVTRAFSPALSLGALSMREVVRRVQQAEESGEGAARGPAFESQWWGRSDLGALIDLIEWKEWHRLLARRDLEIQAARIAGGASPGAVATPPQSSEPAPEPSEPPLPADETAPNLEREIPVYGYWRWARQHLTRYAVWPASGETLDALPVPADASAPEAVQILMVHGFGASSEQWERLARQLRLQFSAAGLPVPRMYALDLIGFGHSEKPGLTYTQHLWEAQVVDFALEVMGAGPFVIAGNSIGGGLASGVASNLRHLCKGVVLCNTAGRLIEPSDFASELESQKGRTVGELTLRVRSDPRALGASYAPPPFGGQPLLDAFGWGLIRYLRPQLRSLLVKYYPTVPAAADAALVESIDRDSSDPGAPNVIASGQKLPPQRSLNEVLGPETGFSGPVLVPQGALDPLTGAELAQSRAKLLKRMRPGVSVAELDAGHCPHDEAPELVAAEIVHWWPALDGLV